jgi:hypothetical protein
VFYAPERRRKPFPKDFTFEGSGVESTLVAIDEFDDTAGPVVNLTFRDMTILCKEYFCDWRSFPASLRFERCRVVGFDIGAGGSVCFSAPSIALWMSDCTLETGYGRNPPSGNVLRVGYASLARFDGCHFVGTNLGYTGAGSVVLRDCTLDFVPDADRASKDPQFQFMECKTQSDHGEWRNAHGTRTPLTSINPLWKDVR